MQETELTKSQVECQLDEHDTYLDFSKEQTINRIMAIQSVNRNRLLKVVTANFNKNKLKQIDQINVLENLQVLEANNNFITQVRLTLAHLLKLDLSSNKLDRFPEVIQLKQLRELNLANNLIRVFQPSHIRENISNEIQQLYLQQNLIKYKSGLDLHKVIEALSEKPNLTVLDISKNPFITKAPQFEASFASIRQLLTLNDKTIENFRKELEDQPQGALEDFIFEQSEFDESEKSETAGELNYRIQLCINEPFRSVDQLKKIQDVVNKVTSIPSQADHYFQDKNPEKQIQIEHALDNFLQACFLFAQNQRNYIELILKSLAQLAIVNYLQFGRRCFEVVVEILRSGAGLTQVARTILRNYSIPLIREQKNINYIPTFVLEGILRTVQERNDFEMVPIDLVSNFTSWLDQIVENYRQVELNLREEQLQRDCLCLNFIAQMGLNREFALKYKNLKIISRCIILFKLVVQQDLGRQYVAVLHILNNCAITTRVCAIEILKSRETANNFIKDVEDELRSYLFMFKKFRNSLVNPETKENREVVNQRYEKVEMLITVYGAICKYKEFLNKQAKRNYLKDDFLVNELLVLATVPAIHPYLVNGIAIFIRKLLKNHQFHEADTDASEVVKYISNKIQNGVQLLQYLGGDFYVPMMKQLDPTISKLTKNLAGLMSVKVHYMIRNIVGVFKFYSKNAIDEKSSIADICLEVSANLNNQGRDQALFLALATPSDMVRLSIVKCLLTIKVTELDTKEVGKLVTLLGTYKNLGAGSTEKVISNIMMILTRIVMGEKTLAQEDFITIYSENCTLDALDILVRNQERDLRDQPEENEEKVELSFGVVNFLKTLHRHKILRQNLKGVYQSSCLRKSLLFEEEYLDDQQFQCLDIEIERTYIGKQCSYLINTLFSKDSLMPYRKESDRILLRLAENLENRREDIPEDLTKFNGLYQYEDIKKHWRKVADQRRKKQLEIWDFMLKNQELEISFEENEDGREERALFEQQHHLMFSQESAVNLFGFLVGRNNSTRTMHLKEHFTEMFLNRMNFDRVIQSIAVYIQDTVDDYYDILRNPPQKKMLSVSNKDVILDHILKGTHMPTDPLRGFGKEVPYFNSNKVILFPILKQNEKETDHLQVNNAQNRDEVLYGKIKQIIPFQNRVVTVATYLRIIYASLACCPIGGGQDSAEQIAKRRDFLRELTLLCEWADWRLGNIGVKYLKIMNFMLRNAQECHQQSFMAGFFIIAKAIRDILDDISLKLQNEDKNPLRYEDIYLIKEVCECMFQVADIISEISYFDKIQEVIEQTMEVAKDIEKEQAKVTIDQRVDEYIITQIMPIHAFKVFIEIMVWDMQNEKRLSSSSVNEPRIFSLKSQMRTHLIKLIGLYILKCRNQKLQILQAFNKLEVFDKKFIRQTFIQEVLDEQYMFDLRFVIEKVIRTERKVMLYDRDVDTPPSLKFFTRCYFQRLREDKVYPALLLLFQGSNYLVFVEFQQEITKTKPQDQILWQDAFQIIKFKKFNILLCFDMARDLEGFYKMESDQRLCFVYQKGGPENSFVQDSKLLNVAFVTFVKLNALEKFEKEISKGIGMDMVSTEGLNFTLHQSIPKLKLWVCKDPDKPIVNRFEAFGQRMMLLVLTSKQLLLFTTNYEEYCFSQRPNRQFTIKITIPQKYKKLTDENAKIQCEQKYFVQKQSYDLEHLHQITIDQTLNAQLDLNFGVGSDLRILFGCDQAREAFRYALMKQVNIDKFQQGIQR